MRWLAWGVVLLAACSFDEGGVISSNGDGSVGSIDARVGNRPDASPPGTPDARPAPIDASPTCPAPVAGSVGATCSNDGNCSGPNAFCLDEGSSWPSSGYCTTVCTSNAACGPGATCSNPIGESGTRICFVDCCTGDSCGGSGRVCIDQLGGRSLGSFMCVPADPGAGDGDPCTSFGDCAPGSFCSDNPFSSPDGYCVTLGCGNDNDCAPAGDGICVDLDPLDGQPGMCLDACNGNGNCRTGVGYTCEPVGAGDSVCLTVNKDVGASCSNDSDCGADPWQCLTGSEFPGGYCGAAGCTGDPNDCPDNAFCGIVTSDAFCVAQCEPGQGDCRSGYYCASFGMGFNGCIKS